VSFLLKLFVVTGCAAILATAGVGVSTAAQAPRQQRLQRCVDVWNLQNITWWTDARAEVAIIRSRCLVTIDGGDGWTFGCWQPTLSSFQCPGHGSMLNTKPQWNALIDARSRLVLNRPWPGRHLPVPKPMYPTWNGYYVPFTSSGQLRRGIRISRREQGTCWSGTSIGSSRTAVFRCSASSRGHDPCFAKTINVTIGGFVMCPVSAGSPRFIKLTLLDVPSP
jgi:hypothetical protein